MNWDRLGIVMGKKILSNFGKITITSMDRVEPHTSKPILPTLKEEILAIFPNIFGDLFEDHFSNPFDSFPIFEEK